MEEPDDFAKLHHQTAAGNTSSIDNNTSSIIHPQPTSETQDGVTLPLLGNNVPENDGGKLVVLEGQNLEESPDSTPKSTKTPESISEPTFIEQWKNSIIAEKPFFFPKATCFIAIILILIYNYVNPTIRSALYNYLMLNCSAIQNESYQTQNQSYPQFNHRLMTYNFLHLDKDQLSKNLLILLLYGIPLEGTIGTLPFVGFYCNLCFSIPLEWYDTQLALKTCATAQPIVGATGVIAALGPFAVIIKFYRLCFKVIVKYLSGSVTNENQLTSFKFLYGIDLFFNLILGLSVLAQFLDAKFYPKEGVENDIHLLAVQNGAFLLIFRVPSLFFWDLLGPIFRIGYEKLSQKISIALQSCLKWFRPAGTDSTSN